MLVFSCVGLWRRVSCALCTFSATVTLRKDAMKMPKMCVLHACDGQEQVHGNDVFEPSAPSAIREGCAVMWKSKVCCLLP